MAVGRRKILIVASEFEPFTNLGYIGRVAARLSASLLGFADVRVAIPMYRFLPQTVIDSSKIVAEFESDIGRRHYNSVVRLVEWSGVPVYLISANDYFETDAVYTNVRDDIERFSCFCDATLKALPRINFEPDVVQCHDWPMSYVPILHKAGQSGVAPIKDFSTLFVIHSMQYQGICSRYDMHDLLDLSIDYFTPSSMEYYGQANSLKGALLFSDRIAAVSESFAVEIHHSYYSENLEGVIRTRSADIRGILCGIDNKDFDPENDPDIAANYVAEDALLKKPANKHELQRALGLEQDLSIPVILAPVDAADFDKGIELIRHVMDAILDTGAQIVFAYKGKNVDFHDFCSSLSQARPAQVAYTAVIPKGSREKLAELAGSAAGSAAGTGDADASDALGTGSAGAADAADVSHDRSPLIDETLLYAGADILLRPSRIEPCGETHMIAMRYGAIPVVRETGGLKDVVVTYNEETGEGNGFSFYNYNAHDMLYTLNRALDVYKNSTPTWQKILANAMSADNSWDVAAAKYAALYDDMSPRN